MDLAQFSKVEIIYSFDGSDATAGNFEAAPSHAIGLKSTASSYGWPDPGEILAGDIAHADMEFSAGGWTAFRTATIDLSEIDYNGPVHVTMHNPAGTTIAISGVIFYYAEKVEEPEDPQPEEPKPEVTETVDFAALSDQAGNGYKDSIPGAGLDKPAFQLGYNNWIAIGEMDLAKYSAVRIGYSFNGSETTENAFNEASSKAIGLKSTASSYGQVTTDNFEGDIAHTDMVFSAGGASDIRYAEIDLTAIDYNGQVYVTIHNPAGTVVIIESVTFVVAQ
jgi:hypothetical protein